MKRKNIYRIVITLIIIALSTYSMVYSQPPGPPGGHGMNGNQGAGGTAPIDGGTLMLVLSGLGYGIIKAVRAHLPRVSKK
jgi:hypothetical protein